ncbi:hypothetical protein ACTXQV_66410, partial [Klebsiella pneumoniae]
HARHHLHFKIGTGQRQRAVRIATDSTIWDKTKSDQDSVVFRSTDFTNPNTSQTFALLSTYPALKDHVKNFAAICNVTKLETIPSLSDF